VDESRIKDALTVLDQGREIAFSFEDMLKYHGPGSPGGVAHAFKMLQRALPLLDPDRPPERRELAVRTAFGGPGARDAVELVTRAVTEARYVVDPSLGRPERGLGLERFVFRLAYRDRAVTLICREGYVSDEFIALARTPERTPEQERRLVQMKLELADHVMSASAADVYEVADSS
jgi:hypothetical protein